jgi:cell division protein FtsB
MNINTEAYIKKAEQFIRRMGDVRFAGQVLFVIIVLLISWSGIKSIQTNYGLQKQISGLKQHTEVQQLQNNNLALQNEYYKSTQYLELSARQNFGLANAGEKEIVVPATVALAYTVDLPNNDQQTQASAHQPAYQRHFQAWVDFFLHRTNN